MTNHILKWWHYLIAVTILLLLAIISLSIGTGDLSIWSLLTGGGTANEWRLLIVSRIPRTIAIILAGASLSIGGLIMQSIMQNRFVEPSTTGVTESVSLTLLIVTLLLPNASLFTKMSLAIVGAIIGSLILLSVIRALSKGQVMLVPLIGIILAGIINAVANLIAWHFDLQATLSAWRLGDFSGVLKGRYEMIYFEAILLLVAYLYAERFTIVSLGKDISINLGLNYRQITLIGVVMVAMISAISMIVAGTLPFLGIVVPNIVAYLFGDNIKSTLPMVAMGGAIFVLMSDMISRLMIYPAEIPVGTVIGTLGSGLFLFIIFKWMRRRVL